MRIECVGAGPAGLTFAVLAARRGHDVTVVEARPEGTWGLGVVLWPDFLDGLAQLDPQLVDRLVARAVLWEGQRIEVPGRPTARLDGRGHGISRAALLDLLAATAEDAGARLERGRRVEVGAPLKTDLRVVADGASSRLRTARARAHGTAVGRHRNRYAWLQLDRASSAFLFPFVRTEHGWFWAHAYPFRQGATTFVVETTEAAWRGEGFDRMTPDAAIARLEELFADQLDGGRLTPPAAPGASLWEDFRLVENRRWADGRTVLIGDAAHTTHFSIGSGTRLAMEDAVALVDALDGTGSLEDRLHRFGARRRAELVDVQRAARRSTRFFEDLPRYIDRPIDEFTRLVERRRARLLPWTPVPLFLAAGRARDRLRAQRAATT